MGPGGRPKRRALTNREFSVVIALFMGGALIAGFIWGALDLPAVFGVLLTVPLTAALVAVVIRGRPRSAAAAPDGAVGVDAGFTMVMRGYDVAAVDAVVQRARVALASDDPAVRASAREELRQVSFPIRFRGYDQEEVRDYLGRTNAHLA
jgi:DivIVA domain-containing protein